MLNTFCRVLLRLKGACTNHYEMLLEADVCGLLFYLLLTEPEIESREVHLDTRVDNYGDGRPDVAVGPIEVVEEGRPCVKPKLLVEVKLFPERGF